MNISKISFGQQKYHLISSNKNEQAIKTDAEQHPKHSHNTAKILVTSMLVLLPLIKVNIHNESNVNSNNEKITEEQKDKSENLIEYAVNKLSKNVSGKKEQEDKLLESKLIGVLEPIINTIGKKLMSSTKIRGKVEDKIFGDTATKQLDEFLFSEDAKIKSKIVLQDKEIQEALVQALANKHTDKNVKYLCENPKIQNALFSILKDPGTINAIDKIGIKNNIPKSIVEAVEGILNNESFIKLHLNNVYLQEMISEFLKHPDDGFKFKKSKMEQLTNSKTASHVARYNNFINASMNDSFISTTADSVKTFGTLSATVGEGVGDVVGFYIPVVGKPVFGTTGKITGGLLGTIYAPVRNSFNECLKLFCKQPSSNDLIKVSTKQQ